MENKRPGKGLLGKCLQHDGPMPGNGWKDEGTNCDLKSFITQCGYVYIYIIYMYTYIYTYVDGDTCETCFHCQSLSNPRISSACALVASQISCQEGLKSANEALRISEESGDRRGQVGL